MPKKRPGGGRAPPTRPAAWADVDTQTKRKGKGKRKGKRGGAPGAAAGAGHGKQERLAALRAELAGLRAELKPEPAAAPPRPRGAVAPATPVAADETLSPTPHSDALVSLTAARRRLALAKTLCPRLVPKASPCRLLRCRSHRSVCACACHTRDRRP